MTEKRIVNREKEYEMQVYDGSKGKSASKYLYEQKDSQEIKEINIKVVNKGDKSKHKDGSNPF